VIYFHNKVKTVAIWLRSPESSTKHFPQEVGFLCSEHHQRMVGWFIVSTTFCTDCLQYYSVPGHSRSLSERWNSGTTSLYGHCSSRV